MTRAAPVGMGSRVGSEVTVPRTSRFTSPQLRVA